MKKPYSLLVVDSNPFIRRLITRELGGCGYQVSDAANMTEIRDRLESAEPVDLIIVDPDLPDSDEAKSITHIHATRPDLPIVIHAYGSEGLPTGEQSQVIAIVRKCGSSIEDIKKMVGQILPLH